MKEALIPPVLPQRGMQKERPGSWSVQAVSGHTESSW